MKKHILFIFCLVFALGSGLSAQNPTKGKEASTEKTRY